MRLLRAGDEEALQRFLQAQGDSSLIMLANAAAAGLTDGPARYQGAYAGAVEAGVVTAAAAHYWNGMLVLQAPAGAARLAALALAASGRPLTGVLGPALQVAALRRDLKLPHQPGSFQSEETLMSVDLDELALPDALAARAVMVRPARSSELDILANWRTAFVAEAFRAREDAALRADARAEVEAWQAERANFVLSVDGKLVAACAITVRFEDRLQLGSVWTPPAWRGRGFARCVVAGALARLRARGARRAVLFTDNPAAERAYRAIGFRPRGGAYSLLRFAAPLQFSLPKPAGARTARLQQPPLAKSLGAA